MSRARQLLTRTLLFVNACACVSVSVALSSAIAGAQTSRTHAASLDDMLRIRTINDLAVSSDGRFAAYVTSSRSATVTAEATDITILDLDRHRTWAVAVPGRPSGLEWSPGARTVLALVISTAQRSQVWQYSPFDSSSGPRPIEMSDSVGGRILAFAWSPDGESIAYLAADGEAASGGDGIRKPATRLLLFRDSPGDITGPTSSLYSIDSAGTYVAAGALGDTQARILARHLVSAKGGPHISWSATGMLLVNGEATNVSWQSQLKSGLVYIIDPSSGKVVQLKPGERSRKRAVWSPSGKYVASLRFEFLPNGHLPVARYTLELEHGLGPECTIVFDSETDGLVYALPPMWGKDDRKLYVARRQRATARLFVIDVESGTWRPLTTDTLAISRYAISKDGRVLLGVLENANRAQDVFRINPANGGLTRLTHLGDDLTSIRLGHVQQMAWRSRDKRFTVNGFLVSPPAYDSGRRYPLIVLAHGGPGHLYTNTFLDINFARYGIPAQLLAAAGYMVLLPNPRGDASYGVEFEEALHADWGPGPFSDIDAGIDALISRGLVDSTAIGIGGASYGGFLAAYAITHSRRFAAASIDDGPVNLASEYAQNYAINSSWAKATFDGTPWTRPDIYALQSPITRISRVRTPVIMRYGGRSVTYDDIRQSYMLAQGFELYAGLRDTGVPVEFVLHPDQGHGITDWGLYEDWIARNLRWFDFWIRGLGSNPLAAVR